MRSIALILCALCLADAAIAQPANVTRTLRRFDFEERSFNVEDLPVDWQKVEGDGLPFYVNGRLSRDRARSGRYSFRFDLNGGSLIYRYPAGKLAVREGAHYRVDAWVRTTPMPHARARVTAYLSDLDGRALRGTIRHSEPYAAEQDDDPWRRLSVELTASDARAAYLVIELELVQPGVYRPSTLGAQALFAQDIRGTAWFDDVSVSQVPRVTMTTDRPGNVFPVDAPVQVRVTVNDRFTDDLSAQLTVRDAEGRLVMQQNQQLDLAGAKQIGEHRKQLLVTLPQMSSGWYDVRVAMSSQGQLLGEQSLPVIKLSDSGEALPVDPRVGVVATHLPMQAWLELQHLLPLIGAGRVKLAVWSPDADVQEASGVRFDELLESLRRLRITPTACLTGLPPAVADAVGGESWLALLKANPEKWRPRLAYLIARHATYIDRWQIGEDSADHFVSNPQMMRVFSLLRDEFSRQIGSPDLAMPWPAWYELDDRAPASISLSIPPSVLPHQVPLYVQAGGMARPAGASRVSLTLLPLDRRQYGREVQLRDFAQRFAYAMSTEAPLIDVPLPFDAEADDASDEPAELNRKPQELLLVMRTLCMMLGNAQYRGQVPLAENVDAFLFERAGQGILMMWSRGNEAGTRDLAINLGFNPVRIDLWGNVTPLLAIDSSSAGRARLAVGPMPVFIVGIDAEMMRLRASIAWDNPRVESSFRPHVRRLRFSNPYRTAISGQLKLRVPAGWNVNPPTMTFSLNPGETFTRDIAIEFPYNTFAGVKLVSVDFALQAERETSFTVPLPLMVGLSDIGLQTIALRDGRDVIVQQTITNYGDRPVNYTAFAVFAGQARQERLVTNLGPGRVTVKKYRFANVSIGDSPGSVRSGLKEMEGTRILNDEVLVR